MLHRCRFPGPNGAGRHASASVPAPRGAAPGPAFPPGTTFALGPDPDGNLHRAALEAELLAQPPLDEPAVGRLEEPRGEQDEVRRADADLGGEQDLGLAAAADRR